MGLKSIRNRPCYGNYSMVCNVKYNMIVKNYVESISKEMEDRGSQLQDHRSNRSVRRRKCFSLETGNRRSTIRFQFIHGSRAPQIYRQQWIRETNIHQL